MKQVPLKVKIYNGENFATNGVHHGHSEVEVKAYEFMPGLFIHRTLIIGEFCQTQKPYWDIAHKSGLRIFAIEYPSTRTAILRVAKKYLGKLNWEWDIDHIPGKQSGHVQAVKKMKEELARPE